MVRDKNIDNKEKLLEIIEVFWFGERSETLLFIKEQIDNLSNKRLDLEIAILNNQNYYSYIIDKKIIKILSLFEKEF